MKRKLEKVILSVSVLLFCGFSNPCDPEKLLTINSPKLEDFVFIKAFNVEVNKKGDTYEYSYVLSRGSSYKIVVGVGEENGTNMVISLYDRDKKLIATNYLKAGKKYFPTLNYTCAATGVYYVKANFENDSKGCGINILGFKK